MKRIVISVFTLAVLFGAVDVMAKEDKAPKAENIKIHKKQALSDDERKVLDETKGKPAVFQEKSVFTLPATGVLGESLPDGGKKYAIVVGLANYTGTVNDLCVLNAKTTDQFPENNKNLTKYCQDYDSVHMREALIAKYGYDTNNIIFLRDGSATRTNILGAMEGLKTKPLTSNDEVAFFFSGHGTSGELISLNDGETIDEAIFTYDNNYIWDDELKIWADSLGVDRMVFIFDTCLSGGMNDLAGNNRVVAMSSLETQNSWTYYLGGYNTGTKKNPVYQRSEGLFSRYFVVNGMTNNLADKSNSLLQSDGKVSVEEAFGFTYPLVEFRQNPVLSDNFLDDWVL